MGFINNGGFISTPQPPAEGGAELTKDPGAALGGTPGPNEVTFNAE